MGSGGHPNSGKKKGSPKTGGRQKGSPNTDRQALLARAKELGLDPWDALCTIAADKASELTLRFQAVKEVCSYIYTKTKAVEVSAPGGGPLENSATEAQAALFKEWLTIAKAERK